MEKMELTLYNKFYAKENGTDPHNGIRKDGGAELLAEKGEYNRTKENA